MQTLIVDLVISAEEFQKLYQGSAKHVLCHSQDGRRVRFPASILRQFVTMQGISGRFQITFDDENRFSNIMRL